jgi:ribosomal protein L10
MSTNNFKNLRESITDSKFLMGKNKVMAVAFGQNEENSFKLNTYKISEVTFY